MHFLPFLFALNSCAKKPRENWRGFLHNIFKPGHYESCETKTKINYLVSLQLYTILAKAANLDDDKDPNLIYERKAKDLHKKLERLEERFANSIEKTISEFTISNVPQILEKHQGEIEEIIKDTHPDGLCMFTHFQTLFEIPIKMLNNEYLGFEPVYKACVNKIASSKLGERALKVLFGKVKALKFLNKREYGSEDDLKELIENISVKKNE